MNLLARSRPVFESCMDRAWSPETSIVARYRNAMRFADSEEHDLEIKKYLLECGIREGERVVQPVNYKGVAIHILDETSLMATGSLKSIDGCLAAALCRMEGAGRVVFESGGNTGSALTRYGRKAGLETYFFCPLENMDLLDSGLFDGVRGHLIGVEDRGQVKELAGLFSRAAGVRHIPDKPWRYAAAMFRGLFILEHILTVRGYDWIAQMVSAGFGPIGIYKVLSAYRTELPGLPRFLGVQQEANCPVYESWKPPAVRLEGRVVKEKEKLLSRVMYDGSPQTYNTYTELHRLLETARGDLVTVNGEEFDTYVYPSAEYGGLLDLLLARGISLRLRSGRVMEKTGMIALAGTLKAIDAGTIEAGSSVLCCLTSGVSEADGRARPEVTVHSARDVSEYIKTLQGGG